jgi:hypothetical protein
MKQSIIYHGNKRPFMFIINYGEVYLHEGDEIVIEKIINNYYLDVNNKLRNWHVYANTAIPYSLYGHIDNNEIVSFITDMINGKYKTLLEYQQESIEKIKNNLPKENFKLIKWQGNSYYPVYNIEYKDGMYLDTTYPTNNPITDQELAWSIYYNTMRLLPKEYYFSENSEMLSKSIKLY